MSDVFANMNAAPYWWDEAPRPDEVPSELPSQVDALIVGGGFSGLTTARVLANAGKSVLVCEAGQLGIGASTRNGGMLGPSFHKLGIAGLTAHYGKERTHALLRESIGFVDFVRELITTEKIECDFRQSGRFRCASSTAHYDAMSRELGPLVEHTGVEAEALPKHRVREEIGTDRFHGGIRYEIDGGLHPGKYHDGLVRVVRDAGGIVATNTEVINVNRDANGFAVVTTQGIVNAGQVAICTNAYTKKVSQWFRRRLIPIRSSLIATEPLDSTLMRELMPTQRMYGDSRRIQAYYRPSPDGKRILFGGRATSSDKPVRNAELMRQSMLEVFPQLKNTQITHSWSGLVAYSFDHVPHLGQHDDLFYAMGYCGSGVARSSYFGTKVGHKMLGQVEEGACAFDDLPFKSRPLYTGTPWFLPAIIRWHRFIDDLGF
ncbi:MAG: glycine/D-amino acid oxidase-like deaminating enzyme [Woeseiaceae bacterium]|jgi:glycine/D-amino acid oxidase-like deaminating enzyme